jgi:hypothetical protein
MTYLDALEAELATAGIPARRRSRILTEFADHLAESPDATLGAPRELARQFADEIGTRLARRTAYTAFAALAVVAAFLVVMFLAGGRQHGWVGYGSYHDGLAPRSWWGPLQVALTLTAEVALASGVLAALRAYQLRHEPAISAADAAIINRRTALALVAAAVTMVDLPLTAGGATNLGAPVTGIWWPATQYGGYAAIVLLLSLLPAVLAAARLKPQRDGDRADLVGDLGLRDPRVTPLRVVLAFSAVIVVALTLIGAHSGDAHDGLIRGLLDAVACLGGFAVLGRFLGLTAVSAHTTETARQTAQ